MWAEHGRQELLALLGRPARLVDRAILCRENRVERLVMIGPSQSAPWATWHPFLLELEPATAERLEEHGVLLLRDRTLLPVLVAVDELDVVPAAALSRLARLDHDQFAQWKLSPASPCLLEPVAFSRDEQAVSLLSNRRSR
jgi:hypothetical protein